MKTTQFKTNIKCSGCVEKVTPYLNELLNIDEWQVDLTHPSRILTITGEVTEEQVKEALSKAGYKAENS